MSNETNQNEKVYYSKVSMLHRENKDAPLESASFAVSGEISFAEKKSGQYGDFISVTLTATLRDKFVEYYFGKELVTPDHKVSIRFILPLSKDGENKNRPGDRFVQYPPRWGQDAIFMLYGMKIDSFKRRDGETGYNINAKCADFSVLGSTKKADGSDRPVINIRGLDNASATSSKPATSTNDDVRSSVKDAMDRLGMGGDFEADDDLPF